MDQQQYDVFSANCVSRGSLEHVTGRWGALTLAALGIDGGASAQRFGGLRRRIGGISEKMLSQTLKALEADGFVERSVQATLPPHVEYRLTPAGLRIAAAVGELIAALYEAMDDVKAEQGG